MANIVDVVVDRKGGGRLAAPSAAYGRVHNQVQIGVERPHAFFGHSSLVHLIDELIVQVELDAVRVPVGGE